MTPVALRILDLVRERIATTGCSPTFREMAKSLGVASRSSLHQQVDRLVEAGHLLRSRGECRGLRLPEVDLRAVPTGRLLDEVRRRSMARPAA